MSTPSVSFNERVLHLLSDAVQAKLRAQEAQAGNSERSHQFTANEKIVKDRCKELSSLNHIDLGSTHAWAKYAERFVAWSATAEEFHEEFLQTSVLPGGLSFASYLNFRDCLLRLSKKENQLSLKYYNCDPPEPEMVPVISLDDSPGSKILERLENIQKSRAVDCERISSLDARLEGAINERVNAAYHSKQTYATSTYPPTISCLLQSDDVRELVREELTKLIEAARTELFVELVVQDGLNHGTQWTMLHRSGLLSLINVFEGSLAGLSSKPNL